MFCQDVDQSELEVANSKLLAKALSRSKHLRDCLPATFTQLSESHVVCIVRIPSPPRPWVVCGLGYLLLTLALYALFPRLHRSVSCWSFHATQVSKLASSTGLFLHRRRLLSDERGYSYWRHTAFALCPSFSVSEFKPYLAAKAILRLLKHPIVSFGVEQLLARCQPLFTRIALLACSCARSLINFMELMKGVEPITVGLQNRCSAIELHQLDNVNN